ncbi:arylamine N-acetyltransferase family protein [Bowmanella dokdonensis]|uniref:Arylamine N-acetyltransferase n=1 Tax=Bowmanella dokdonensis TaxID=751969 RepID=A0A939IMM2_9ALTE|nr:arylamine N-acetyltransferase [Bowmanella dokdonensis]MBN7825448.1 arylamine N-acetyltransferase [Bowmanella dokdonensis]
MTQQFDQRQYLLRIGYSGVLAPTLEVVSELVARHTRSIPFENLSSFMGQRVGLDPSELQQKMLHDGRGGYCYEQNGLFRMMLESLGLKVEGLAARVLWNADPAVMPAISHMLLKTHIEGQPYLFDVGFGVQTPTAPLRLVTGTQQMTPHGLYRLSESSGEYLLEADIAGKWVAVYRFDLKPRYPADYQMFNWYVSTHPESVFVKNLVAAKVVPGARYTLRNNELSIYPNGGPKQRKTLQNPAEIAHKLTSLFAIRLPHNPGLMVALERLCQSATVI